MRNCHIIFCGFSLCQGDRSRGGEDGGRAERLCERLVWKVLKAFEVARVSGSVSCDCDYSVKIQYLILLFDGGIREKR